MLRHFIPFFLHPLPLSAVLLMGLNDHLFKYWFPGMLTGKLSDFAGVFYFPLLLAALWVLSGRVFGWRLQLTPKLLLSCIMITNLLMLMVKLSSGINHFIVENFSTYLFSIQIIKDPTDLLALVMNIPTYLFGRRYFTESQV